MVYFYLTALSLFILYCAMEYRLLTKARKQIELRILVNGTRGKSTMVQLVHQMLTGAGMPVFAKTTGDQPQIMDPQGHKSILKRTGPASIMENVRWLKRISKEKPDAVILECMALQPETQHVLSARIFKPHVILLTNINEDHAEVMGQNLHEMTRTIAQCLSKPAHLILRQETLQLLQNAKVRLPDYRVAGDAYPDIHANPERQNLPPDVIKQYASLLNALADRLKIDSAIPAKVIEQYIARSAPLTTINAKDRKFIFYDLFSVNDTRSATTWIDQLISSEQASQIVFLLNTRGDRPLRTRAFCEMLNNDQPESAIWLHGSGSRLAKRFLAPNRVIEQWGSKHVLNYLAHGFQHSTMIIGLGNRGGAQPITQKLLSLQQIKRESQS